MTRLHFIITVPDNKGMIYYYCLWYLWYYLARECHNCSFKQNILLELWGADVTIWFSVPFFIMPNGPVTIGIVVVLSFHIFVPVTNKVIYNCRTTYEETLNRKCLYTNIIYKVRSKGIQNDTRNRATTQNIS